MQPEFEGFDWNFGQHVDICFVEPSGCFLKGKVLPCGPIDQLLPSNLLENKDVITCLFMSNKEVY